MAADFFKNPKPVLYHYWRSSASWRVRWGLQLKKIEVDYRHVSLLDGSSESPEHLAISPMGYVPVLATAGKYLIESLPILEFLDELCPEPAFFPGDAFDRAHVRALCELINAGTQPMQNLNVTDFHSADPSEKLKWNRYFTQRGLSAYQDLASPRMGSFSLGDRLTAADIFLIPQVYNAKRFEIDVEKEFPRLWQIYQTVRATPECKVAEPEAFEPGR